MSIGIENGVIDERSKLLYKVIGDSLKGFTVLNDDFSLVCETRYNSILDAFLQKVLVNCRSKDILDEPENISQCINQTVNDMIENNHIAKDISVLNWIKENDITLLQGTVNYISKSCIVQMINDYIQTGLAKYIHIEQMVNGYNNPIVVSLLITTTIPLKTLRREINIKYVSSNNLPVRPINTLPNADRMFHDLFSNPQETMRVQRPYRDTFSPNMEGFNNTQHFNDTHQEPTNRSNIDIEAVFGEAILKYFLITNPEVGELRELNEKEIDKTLSLLKCGIEFKDNKFIYKNGYPKLHDLLIRMLINRWFLPSSKDTVDKLFRLETTINEGIEDDTGFEAIVTYVDTMLSIVNTETSPLMTNIVMSFLDDLTSN